MRSLVFASAVIALALGEACQASSSADGSGVVFGSAAPVGAWLASDGAGGAAVPVTGTGGMGGTVIPQASGMGGTVIPQASGMGGGSAMLPPVGSLGGAGGMAASGSGGSGAQAGASGTLSFDVVTQNQGGRYAPRNVGAIWIENSAGKFVKTLKVWAGTRGRYLTKFSVEAGANRVDAVTSATISNYGMQHATWNLKDASGNLAPDGSYKVIIEVTDHDGSGQSTQVDFMKTPMPMTVTPPNAQYFTAMRVTLQ
jgi:hypothetical protein